jgi:hypothetical protein
LASLFGGILRFRTSSLDGNNFGKSQRFHLGEIGGPEEYKYGLQVVVFQFLISTNKQQKASSSKQPLIFPRIFSSKPSKALQERLFSNT